MSLRSVVAQHSELENTRCAQMRLRGAEASPHVSGAPRRRPHFHSSPPPPRQYSPRLLPRRAVQTPTCQSSPSSASRGLPPGGSTLCSPVPALGGWGAPVLTLGLAPTRGREPSKGSGTRRTQWFLMPNASRSPGRVAPRRWPAEGHSS